MSTHIFTRCATCDEDTEALPGITSLMNRGDLDGFGEAIRLRGQIAALIVACQEPITILVGELQRDVGNTIPFIVAHKDHELLIADIYGMQGHTPAEYDAARAPYMPSGWVGSHR